MVVGWRWGWLLLSSPQKMLLHQSIDGGSTALRGVNCFLCWHGGGDNGGIAFEGWFAGSVLVRLDGLLVWLTLWKEERALSFANFGRYLQ